MLRCEKFENPAAGVEVKVMTVADGCAAELAGTAQPSAQSGDEFVV